MELRAGYKQTEVGVVPAEWEVKTLGEICRYQNGTSLEKYFNALDGYRVISIGNYSTAGKYVDTGVFISLEYKEKVKKFILNKDELTMILNDKTSTGEILGRVLLIPTDAAFVFNQRTMRLSVNENVLPTYLYFLLNSQFIHRKIVARAKPGTQIYINTGDVTELIIPVPPLTEQQAITAALNDVDALIAALDMLIAKKRNIKQGAMQELLTGKRRLAGFGGEVWEARRLGELFAITAGKPKRNVIEEGGRYFVVDMGSVSTGGKLIVTKQTNFENDFLEHGDLVMPKDDIGGGKIIGKVAFIDQDRKYILGDHVYKLTCLQGNSQFLCFLINSHHVNSSLRACLKSP